MKKKFITHRLEAALACSLLAVCRALPLDAASGFGGQVARWLGPFFPAHKVALDNLARAFPEFSLTQRQRIACGMWDNIGRVAAELPHIPAEKIFTRITMEGVEHVPKGEAVIFFSGHLGNWELNYPLAFRRGIPITLIYRHANNPLVDEAIRRIRATRSSEQFSKGRKNGVKIIRAIKKGHSLAMLIDQKMNDGIPVPFFGRDAMTAPAIAELALRYNLKLMPARVLRTSGCHFHAKVYPPLAIENTGDEAQDVRTIMTQINHMLEGWIREAPEQWFWVHRRWPKEENL